MRNVTRRIEWHKILKNDKTLQGCRAVMMIIIIIVITFNRWSACKYYFLARLLALQESKILSSQQYFKRDQQNKYVKCRYLKDKELIKLNCILHAKGQKTDTIL